MACCVLLSATLAVRLSATINNFSSSSSISSSGSSSSSSSHICDVCCHSLSAADDERSVCRGVDEGGGTVV